MAPEWRQNGEWRVALKWRHYGAIMAPFATWRQNGAIMAPLGDAFIISHTNAHRHVAVPPRLAIFWRMANFEFAIMAPRGAEWRHSFARMAPFWRRNGAILAVDRIRHFLAPFGAILSPLGATWRHAGAIMAPKWRHLAPFCAHDLKYYTTQFSLIRRLYNIIDDVD